MRVVIRKTKCGFRIVEADEIRFEEGSILVMPRVGEEFKVGRHKSWDDGRVELFLEQEGTYGKALNLSPLSRDYIKWKEAPF